MIKWTVYKTTMNYEKVIRNLMNIHAWSFAVKFVFKKNKGANWEEYRKERLRMLESEEVHSLIRRK